MFKKFFPFCLVILIAAILFNGCQPVIINNSSPELNIKKIQGGFQITGKLSREGSVFLIYPKNVSLNQKFEMSGKILLTKGTRPFSNICLGIVTNDGKSFSFGPRGGSLVYLAAYDNKGITDQVNQKPFFGDEDKNFHTIIVKYDPQNKIFKAYIDGIVFGEIDGKKILLDSAAFTKMTLSYNAPEATDVDVTFKEIKFVK